MKGVVVASTGRILATPSPAELVNSFSRSPNVGLNSCKIFDFEEGDSRKNVSQERHDDGVAKLSHSPSSRKERKVKDKGKNKDDASSENSTPSFGMSAANTCRSGTPTDEDSSTLNMFLSSCIMQSTGNITYTYVGSCWFQYQWR